MTKYPRLTLLPALLATLLLTAPAVGDNTSVQSLRPTDVGAADKAPEQKPMLGKRPGAQQAIPRSFEQQPPLIPHAMTNFDEITAVDNQCLECHGADTFEKKNAPKVGDSHFRDPSTGAIQTTMSGTRYQCTLCHVPQADAAPLVENSFQPAPPVKAGPQ
jgi:cytochrome c-type protein NapB